MCVKFFKSYVIVYILKRVFDKLNMSILISDMYYNPKQCSLLWYITELKHSFFLT